MRERERERERERTRERENERERERFLSILHNFCFWTCSVIFKTFGNVSIIFVYLFANFSPIHNGEYYFMNGQHMCVLSIFIFSRSPFRQALLLNGNYFFTAVFAIESFIKLFAMSPRYFFSVSQLSRSRPGLKVSKEKIIHQTVSKIFLLGKPFFVNLLGGSAS